MLVLVTQQGSWQVPEKLIESSRVLSDIVLCDDATEFIHIYNSPDIISSIPILVDVLDNIIGLTMPLEQKFILLQLCDYLDIPIMQEKIAVDISLELNKMDINHLRDIFENM